MSFLPVSCPVSSFHTSRLVQASADDSAEHVLRDYSGEDSADEVFDRVGNVKSVGNTVHHAISAATKHLKTRVFMNRRFTQKNNLTACSSFPLLRNLLVVVVPDIGGALQVSAVFPGHQDQAPQITDSQDEAHNRIGFCCWQAVLDKRS